MNWKMTDLNLIYLSTAIGLTPGAVDLRVRVKQNQTVMHMLPVCHSILHILFF